ncbi:hypothetical protein BDW59DRAFT_144927 [Aspergillus cavernicola]|uniref:Gamma-glutamylcyclotransferase AIG2-like domain-containing protein n=1 Tax=Aspergillus cavernicola TaxID=176166 RepID=A0ABR4IFR4_9EURO
MANPSHLSGRTPLTTNMRWEQGYPLDFKDALERFPSRDELTKLVAQPSSNRRFIYGAMMLPTVLKYFLDLPQSAKIDMVYATLPGYELYEFSKDGLPTIKPSSDSDAVVQGMLIFGLDRNQRKKIFEVESDQIGKCEQSKLVNVPVQIYQEDLVDSYNIRRQRIVYTKTYVWNSRMDGLEPMNSKYWPMDIFLQGQLYENIEQHQNGVHDKDEDDEDSME